MGCSSHRDGVTPFPSVTWTWYRSGYNQTNEVLILTTQYKPWTLYQYKPTIEICNNHRHFVLTSKRWLDDSVAAEEFSATSNVLGGCICCSSSEYDQRIIYQPQGSFWLGGLWSTIARWPRWLLVLQKCFPRFACVHLSICVAIGVAATSIALSRNCE